MPRKGHVPKRKVLPDPIYGSPIVTRLINNIMKDGKKGVAQKILYNAFEIVEKKTGRPALDVFNDALNNISPIGSSAPENGGQLSSTGRSQTRKKMTLALRSARPIRTPA